jgi:putative transposase
MPRPPRLHVPGGMYHVILRGNHREALFDSAHDRNVLNDIVSTAISRFHIRVHAFCWMTNHLHAIVQIAERPLGESMKRVAMRYSRYRHKALRTTGHLFERRYKAKLVDVDGYFLSLLRYVHRNPVKAGMITDPAQYPWSSHRAYLGLDILPWLTTDFGLSLFSNDLHRARVAYRRFIDDSGEDEARIDEETHPEDSRILGSDIFVAKLPFVPYKPRSPITLNQLAAQICTAHAISIERLCSRSSSRALTPIRLQLAHQAIDNRIATLSEVARFLDRDLSTLCKLMLKHQVKSQ